MAIDNVPKESDRQAIRDEVNNDPEAVGYVQDDHKNNTQLITFRPEIDNPESPAQVPIPLKMNDILSLIPSEDAPKISDGLFQIIRDAVSEQDHAAVKRAASFALARGEISENTFNSVDSHVNQTVDDPNYKQKIRDDSRLQKVTEDDIGGLRVNEMQEIMNNG